ncbi:MAG: hypothetical protein Q7U34_05040, partial [Anaerolineales bacterium]|nr:hypothetical protein [Anaerolineales bacterium]
DSGRQWTACGTVSTEMKHTQSFQTQRAQRFALLAGGRAWTMLGSRKNSKPEKCLKMATNPTCPVHAMLGIAFS